MNEHIEGGTALVDLLKDEYKFTVGAEELNLYKTFSCVKMRSAAQFQINKISHMDQSTKDVIIGCSPVTDYLNIKTDVSDHNAIIASIQVQSKNQGQRKSRGLTSLCSGIMTISEEKQCETDFRINARIPLNRLLNNTIEFIKKEENNSLSLSGLGNAIYQLLRTADILRKRV